MFHSARIKLTAWYLLIITFVCFIFSVAIFQGINSELTRFARIQQIRMERETLGMNLLPPEIRMRLPDPDDLQTELQQARLRVILILSAINITIIIISGGIGYVLAGRTLRPIKEMVDEQNRFIADASHELRTPLTALKSAIEVNLRDKHLALADVKSLLASNLEEVDQLQTLSDALLKLAQYHQSHEIHHVKTVSLVHIVDEAVKKVQPLADKKNICLIKKIQNHDAEVDVKAIVEVIIILLDNAIKYSPEKSAVHIMGKKTNTSVILSVQDEGIGIDTKELPHIFDRFYRADKSRSKEHIPGYGLGLSIAKKIIESHKGYIEARQNKGQGSTFIVKLPIKQF